MTTAAVLDLLWTIAIGVGVPMVFAVATIGMVHREEQPASAEPGRWGAWRTGLAAGVLAFGAAGLWLSWSADAYGSPRGPSLPPPTDFPAWQILCCGATVVAGSLYAAHRSAYVWSGGLAAAAGSAAGFTTAFSVAVQSDTTGQFGGGMIMSMGGVGIGLVVIMMIRGMIVGGRRARPPRP